MNRFYGAVMKFRVFDRIHKTIWVAGEPSILPGDEIPDDGSGYILMQYTGKYDMTGKEVYEGDVIENPYGNSIW